MHGSLGALVSRLVSAAWRGGDLLRLSVGAEGGDGTEDVAGAREGVSYPSRRKPAINQ